MKTIDVNSLVKLRFPIFSHQPFDTILEKIRETELEVLTS